MATSKVQASWNGSLKEGSGTMQITGYSGPFTYASRFEPTSVPEDSKKTNPEELIGAANAGCFSMFLSALLGNEEDLVPESVETTASVTLDSDDTGPVISRIELDTKVRCEGLSLEKFEELTETAKKNCPISRVLAATEISLNKTLL